MTRLIRILRLLLRMAGRVVLGIIALALIAIGYFGFTKSGARLVAQQISNMASSPAQVISIETDSSLLGGALRAPVITLSDSRGVYARIEGLEVDWSPSALLRMRFEAQSIRAMRVAYLRAAESRVETDTQEASPFRLPVAIDIARIDLPDILVGADVAGKSFSLAARGSGRANREDIVLSLQANRKDAPDAKAFADVAYVPGENRLTLKATLDEPRDGMLAALFRLPGRPALHFGLDGTGPLSDWVGQMTAQLDGADAFALNIRHQSMADNGHRLTMDGEGTAEPLMPDTIRSLFRGKTAFAFDVGFVPGGRLSIQQGTMTSESATLVAAGVYDPAGDNSLKARLSGRDGPLALNLPVGTEAARLSVRALDVMLTGRSSAAVLDARADLETVAYPDYRIDDVLLTARGTDLDLQARSGQVNARLSFERSAFKDENLARLLPGPFALELPVALSGERVNVSAATIESARLGGTVSASYDLGTRDLQSELKVFALPAVLPETLAAKAGERIALSTKLSYAQPEMITLSGLTLTSDILTAQGDLMLKDRELTADLTGRLPLLSAFLKDAKGEARFSLSASGNPVAPDFKATLESEKAVLSGRVLDRLSLHAEGKADPKAPVARIGAEGALAGQPITIETELQTEAGNVSLPVIDARVGPNRLQGALKIASDFLPEGGLTFDLPDIGLVAALAGQKASGDLRGSVRFTRETGRGTARIEASGNGLQRDGVSVRQPVISLSVSDLRQLSASGTVKVLEIASGANRLKGVALEFSRQGRDTAFNLKAGYDGKPLSLVGSASASDGITRIALKSFSAVPKGIPVKLAGPTTLQVEKGVLRIAGLTIQAGKGTISLSGTAGSSLNVKADIKALPLSLANVVQPSLQADGSLSGVIAAKGMPDAPAIDYRLSLDRATMAQIRGAGLQPFAIGLNGNLQAGVVRVDATARNGDGLSIKGGGTAGLTGNRALSLAFDGKVPLKAVSGMLASQGFVVSGNASLDIRIAGSASQPTVQGRITSTDATLVDVRRNLTLENMAVVIDLDRNRAVLSKLNGSLSTGGTVAVTGSVGIAPGSGFPADLKIDLSRAAYVDGKIVSTVVDGTLAMTGPLLGNAILGGKLTLGRSAITIPQKLPASLSQINVQHKNESKAVAQQNADVMSRNGGGSKGSSSSIGLDLTISAPRIFVQGRGIDAELGGDLMLRGSASSPVVSGGFKMKRGRLTILTRRLDFTSGTISFGGDLTPTLDMAAESATGSTTVTVTISGPANDPAVAFSSSPALPQDEVLAQLIFNQSLSRLSVLQIAQLADAVAQLAGGRSTSLFQSLRSNLGVDDLDITSDESGQAQVKAGKYLNDRTYIQVEQGANSGSKASINLDVGRGIKLKGEAGSDGAGAAGIFYEKEY